VKLFVCQSCGNVLYFENRTCGRCGHRLAFLPEKMTFSPADRIGGLSARIAFDPCRTENLDAIVAAWLSFTSP
jgi:hypothetical protein